MQTYCTHFLALKAPVISVHERQRHQNQGLLQCTDEYSGCVKPDLQ